MTHKQESKILNAYWRTKRWNKDVSNTTFARRAKNKKAAHRKEASIQRVGLWRNGNKDRYNDYMRTLMRKHRRSRSQKAFEALAKSKWNSTDGMRKWRAENRELARERNREHSRRHRAKNREKAASATNKNASLTACGREQG